MRGGRLQYIGSTGGTWQARGVAAAAPANPLAGKYPSRRLLGMK